MTTRPRKNQLSILFKKTYRTGENRHTALFLDCLKLKSRSCTITAFETIDIAVFAAQYVNSLFDYFFLQHVKTQWCISYFTLLVRRYGVDSSCTSTFVIYSPKEIEIEYKIHAVQPYANSKYLNNMFRLQVQCGIEVSATRMCSKENIVSHGIVKNI